MQIGWFWRDDEGPYQSVAEGMPIGSGAEQLPAELLEALNRYFIELDRLVRHAILTGLVEKMAQGPFGPQTSGFGNGDNCENKNRWLGVAPVRSTVR
jgi:hypothetical protein